MSNYKKKKMKEFDSFCINKNLVVTAETVRYFISQIIDETEQREKGYIKIPIHEVWEIINKPHRFFNDIADIVEKLPLGEYDFLNFTEDERKEISAKFRKIARTGTAYGSSKKDIEQRVKKEYEESKPTEYYKSKYLACMAKARNVSDCCGESIHISGETTHYYVCNKCLNACDIVKEVKE